MITKLFISRTINVSDMLKAGVSLDELFDADDAREQELMDMFPGPKTVITQHEESIMDFLILN